VLTPFPVRFSPASRTLRRLALVLAAAAAVTVAPPARAQDVIDAKAAAYLRERYLTDLDTLHAKITALAEAIPAEKYSWRPGEGVRSISEALMHIVGEWYFFTPMSVAGKAPENFGAPREALPKLEKITTKNEVLAEMNKSWAHCRAQVANADVSKLTGKYKPWDATLGEAAFVMAGDLHEHLGQLIAYARMNGVTPPWSKKS
jgi:uncharacterized damage-inducible protein DinB